MTVYTVDPINVSRLVCHSINSFLVHFELFFRDTRNLDILSNEDLDFVKAATKEVAPSSYRSCNNNVPQNLSKEEFIPLKNLSKNKDLPFRNLVRVTLWLLLIGKII